MREQDLFAIDYPTLCQEGLIALDIWQTYDVLIVDEGQDILRDTYVEVLDATLRGGLENGKWKMFLDPYQDIFKGIDPEILKKINVFHPAQYKLSINCRNTNSIAIITQILSGIVSDQILKVEGPDTEQYWYRDERDEIREVSKCVNHLLSDKIPASEITILSPFRRENSCVRNGLVEVVYPLKDLQPNISDRSMAINFATINSFKGLESKVILVVDINNLEDFETRQMIYVGCSRALVFLSVFIFNRLKPEYLKLARQYGEKLVTTKK